MKSLALFVLGMLVTAPAALAQYAPPPSCVAWNDGCNSCSRTDTGEAVCTLRACTTYAEGYCSQYAADATAGIDINVTSTGTSASATPIEAEEGNTIQDGDVTQDEIENIATTTANAVSRIWSMIVAFFSNLF